ncbi:MAG: hypothetical protein KGS61_10555 [Verrucomicrobia bacterium]|nr:hypothetical protein [Verrucomicrobiota bacterium]
MSAGFDNKSPDLPSWTQLLGINLRKLRLVLLVLLLLAVAGWYAYRQFNRWEQTHLIVQAREFLAQGDARSAALSAQRALELNFNDLEATRLLAHLADRFGSPAAVFWYARLAQLDPGNLQDSLTWAATALRFGEFASAEQALAGVSRRGRDTVAFHQVAGALALALRRDAIAEQQFAAAASLAPTNLTIQLNLATVRLKATNAAVLSAARAQLERLRHQPEFQTLALRALAVDAERHHATNRALALTRELQANPQAEFKDHLAYLDLLYRYRQAGFETYLGQLQQDCDSRPGNIYTLCTWLNAHELAARTLAWVERLKADLAAQMPIPLAAAEAAALLQDWGRLQSLVADSHWGALDCLRLAFYARLLRERNEYRQFDAKWQQALNATLDNAQLISLLARLVEGWGWRAEAEKAWWIVANGDSGQSAALEALYRLYRERKDTAQLYRVCDRIFSLNPADLVAKNNLAQLALLLNRNVETACRLATENHERNPTEPVFLSTYAFALYRQDKTAEAVKVFSRIPASLLREPTLAAYYGVLLAANGQTEQAAPYLRAANRSPELLPEEQSLVTSALNAQKSP